MITLVLPVVLLPVLAGTSGTTGTTGSWLVELRAVQFSSQGRLPVGAISVVLPLLLLQRREARGRNGHVKQIY
jgi:hypothetical protein